MDKNKNTRYEFATLKYKYDELGNWTSKRWHNEKGEKNYGAKKSHLSIKERNAI